MNPQIVVESFDLASWFRLVSMPSNPPLFSFMVAYSRSEQECARDVP